MPHGLRTSDTRTAQISSLGAVGASGRPTNLIFDTWQLLTGSQGQFQGVEQQSTAGSTMAPSYIYEGRGSI